MICRIENCEKPAWAKGLCPMHLRRLRIHGDQITLQELRTGEN